MIFQQPSTRTRVSFEVAMRQLGGETLLLSASDMQLGRGETVADTARVLSRYVDAIMIRAKSHDQLRELAEHATVPVINGAHRQVASLPDHGRHHDARRASRAIVRSMQWPGWATATMSRPRGSMRSARLGGELRLGLPRRAFARQPRRSTGQGHKARKVKVTTIRRKMRSRMQPASSPMSGCRCMTPMPRPAQSAEALSGECGAHEACAAPMPSSCIACPPIAARR